LPTTLSPASAATARQERGHVELLPRGEILADDDGDLRVEVGNAHRRSMSCAGSTFAGHLLIGAVAGRDPSTRVSRLSREVRREPVAATEDVQIRGVYRCSLHADAYLAGVGLGDWTGLKAQHVRRLADGVHDEGPHGCRAGHTDRRASVGDRRAARSAG
jgi:hypothetical protein